MGVYKSCLLSVASALVLLFVRVLRLGGTYSLRGDASGSWEERRRREVRVAGLGSFASLGMLVVVAFDSFTFFDYGFLVTESAMMSLLLMKEGRKDGELKHEVMINNQGPT